MIHIKILALRDLFWFTNASRDGINNTIACARPTVLQLNFICVLTGRYLVGNGYLGDTILIHRGYRLVVVRLAADAFTGAGLHHTEDDEN